LCKDWEAIGRSGIECPDFCIREGKDKQTNAQVHYELADLCAARAFTKPWPQDDAAALAAIAKRAEAISDLILEFSTKAEALIVEVLTQQGWQREEIGN